MGLAFVTIENPALVLALRAGNVAAQANDLIAALESQPDANAEVIAEVYTAYHALNHAALPLFDAAIARSKALGHYSDMAAQAAPTPEAIERDLRRLYTKAAYSDGVTLRGGTANARINGREVSLAVAVTPIESGYEILSSYAVDGHVVAPHELVRVIGGAA